MCLDVFGTPRFTTPGPRLQGPIHLRRRAPGRAHLPMFKSTALLLASSCLAAASLNNAVASPRPALLRLRGGEDEQPKTGKVWVTSTFTRDHVRFMSELLHYLGAYVGPRALSPKTIEAIMVTMNSINTCPYCTGLHGQLAVEQQAE